MRENRDANTLMQNYVNIIEFEKYTCDRSDTTEIDYGRAMRRVETEVVRVVARMNVEGKRERERPRKRMLDTIESDMSDMSAAGVCVEYVEDRDNWRSRTRVAESK